MEAMSSADPVLAALLGRSNELAAVVVKDGAILEANAAAADLLGPAAARGATVLSIAFDERSRAKLDAALGAAEPTPCEIQSTLRDDHTRPLRLLAIPLDGGARLLLCTGCGVTYTSEMGRRLLDANTRLANVTWELSRRAAEIEAARARLETLGALRDQFIATLAHDVRSPLSAIGLRAAALARGAASIRTEEVAASARAIQTTVARIAELVDRVLDAARLDGGAVVLQRERVSLEDVAREAVEALAPVADRAGVPLELRVEPGTPLVEGDRVRLGQAVGNVLDNAIRHGPRGEPVRITLEETPSAVRCTVRDRGPGVAPERREQIFERFGQAGPAPGAAGLGLFIAARVVALHGGRIWVEDAEPRGAAFVIELPRAA